MAKARMKDLLDGLNEELAEHGLVVELDNLIADETKRRNELALMLARDRHLVA